MLRAAGAGWVLLGHSERRQFFGETDAGVAAKAKAALAAGLLPIVCVGETLAEREAGRTLDVVLGQLDGALAGLERAALSLITLAYEPVWAIGTGRVATPPQAQEVHGAMREHLPPGTARRWRRRTAHPLRGQRQARECQGTARPARRGRRASGRRQPGPAGLRPHRAVRGAGLSEAGQSRRRPAPAAGDPALSPDGRVHRPVVLMVLDGWGCAPDGPGNAVSLAHTPVFDRLLAATLTARWTRPAWPSACRRARWAIPRWVTSTSAPAASSTRT